MVYDHRKFDRVLHNGVSVKNDIDLTILIN